MTLLILSVALYALFRVAPIATEVVTRHAANAAIATFKTRLPPLAESFGRSYSATSKQKGRAVKLQEASESATSALLNTTSMWLGLIARDFAGFDGRGFGINPNVQQDVVNDATRLVDLVRDDAETFPYANELIAELTPLIDAAVAAIDAVKEAREKLQALQKETRTLAHSLQRELVALRRVLRAKLGSSHVDYRRLLVPHTRRKPGADDDVIAAAGESDTVPSLASSQQPQQPNTVTASAPLNGHGSNG